MMLLLKRITAQHLGQFVIGYLPNNLSLRNYCGSRFLFSEGNIVISFWHNVFSSFARFAERCVPSTIQEFLQEPILFHHKIKIDGTFLSRQVCQKLGITSIGKLIYENVEWGKVLRSSANWSERNKSNPQNLRSKNYAAAESSGKVE